MLVLLVIQFTAPATQAAQPKTVSLGGDSSVTRLSIALDKSQIVRFDRNFSDVRVSSGQTAELPPIVVVEPLSKRSIYVLAKRVGTTNVSFLDGRAELIGMLEFEVTLDVEFVQEKIREVTGNSGIKVTGSGTQLVLSGAVEDAPTVERAIEVASQFAPDSVINAMQVASTQQVLLKVRFVETSRNAGRELGVRWDGRGSRSNIRIGRERQPTFMSVESGEEVVAFPPGNAPLLQALSPLLAGGSPFGVALATLLNSGFNIDVLIQALEEKGLGRRLAEPNLVALSGDTATFLAGGQFPVPVPSNDGTVAIEYKDFGVGLAFTPTVLKDGHIHLRIEPEVSELDFSSSVSVAGVTVPALTQRRASTTIEMRDGQSFAIAGLLQNESRRQIAQLPWISSIPIIGALFRSTSFTSRETDLVIIVTPRLVKPGAPDQQMATPLDYTSPANDLDLFLYGKLEVSRDFRAFVEAGGNLNGPFGHILRTGLE